MLYGIWPPQILARAQAEFYLIVALKFNRKIVRSNIDWYIAKRKIKAAGDTGGFSLSNDH